ncbi:MAG: hypothetical protein IPP46_09645 [Bacteroidetes bacterium]|nr:hypothetical protein [Bacteroidota bacterium]
MSLIKSQMLSSMLKFALVVSVVLSVFRPVDAQLDYSPPKRNPNRILLNRCLVSQYLFPALKDVQQEFSNMRTNSSSKISSISVIRVPNNMLHLRNIEELKSDCLNSLISSIPSLTTT